MQAHTSCSTLMPSPQKQGSKAAAVLNSCCPLPYMLHKHPLHSSIAAMPPP
jgi:hypothetical protein